MPRNPGKPTVQEIHTRQTHCIHGHKYTIDTTYWVNRKDRDYPSRQCRECHRLKEIARRAKNHA